MGRASMKTLKETTFQSFLKVCKIQNLKINQHFRVASPQDKENPNSIVFSNGSVILMKDLFAYPSDPEFDELGSLEITGAFIDEVNQITEKAKSIVASRMRHNISDYGIVPKMIMTCNPSKNWTYSQFYRPSTKNELPKHRKFIQALVGDNEFIDPSYKENLLKLPENSRRRLLYGDWEYDDDPAMLIDIVAANDYFTNEHIPPEGKKYITADIARKGKDKTVVRVWHGLRVVDRVELKVSKVTESAELIKALSIKHSVPVSQVIADEDGVGGGVVDILNCCGFVNNSRALYGENYTNLKSQCSFGMANLIMERKVCEPCYNSDLKAMIIEEMEQVKQADIDKDGKVALISKDKVKDNIGRSPDEWDSIMMRFYFELGQSDFYFA